MFRLDELACLLQLLSDAVEARGQARLPRFDCVQGLRQPPQLHPALFIPLIPLQELFQLPAVFLVPLQQVLENPVQRSTRQLQALHGRCDTFMLLAGVGFTQSCAVLLLCSLLCCSGCSLAHTEDSNEYQADAIPRRSDTISGTLEAEGGCAA